MAYEIPLRRWAKGNVTNRPHSLTRGNAAVTHGQEILSVHLGQDYANLCPGEKGDPGMPPRSPFPGWEEG